MELNHDERQDLIDDLLDDYIASAKQVADKCFADSAYHSERDRQALLAGCYQGRIRMLLEAVSFSAPGLFAELLARMKQRKAA